MNTLYVDIDGTLVTWLPDGSTWQVNTDVLAKALAWEGPVVLWSGGGRDYAEMWGDRLLPQLNWTASAKFNPGVEEGDLFHRRQPLRRMEARLHPPTGPFQVRYQKQLPPPDMRFLYCLLRAILGL